MSSAHLMSWPNSPLPVCGRGLYESHRNRRLETIPERPEYIRVQNLLLPRVCRLALYNCCGSRISKSEIIYHLEPWGPDQMFSHIKRVNLLF